MTCGNYFLQLTREAVGSRNKFLTERETNILFESQYDGFSILQYF